MRAAFPRFQECKATLAAMAAAAALWVEPAAGEDAARPGRGGAFDAGPRQKRNIAVYFASFEASERRIYGSFGAKFAPFGGLNQSGFRLLTSSGAKLRDREPATGLRQSHASDARLLAGHEWQTNGLSLTLYAGAALALHSPSVRINTGEARRIGPAAMLDLWQSWAETVRPSRFTSLTLSLDGAGRALYLGARHGFGHPALPFAFGPEASLSLGDRLRTHGRIVQQAYRKARLGFHLSEIPLAGLTWRLSGGAEWRDEHGRPGRQGGYDTLSAHYVY